MSIKNRQKNIGELLKRGLAIGHKALAAKNALSKKNLFAKALACYRQVLAVDKKNYRAWQGAGRTLLHQKKFKKAMAIYETGRGLASGEKKHLFLNGIGNVYRYAADYDKNRLKMLQKSVAAYKSAARARPMALYFSNLSVAYAAIKNWTLALSENERALRCLKKEKIPHGNLEKILRLENRLYKEYIKRTLN